jgi:hypothetical protein
VFFVSCEAGKGQVVNLNVRRKIATVGLPGLPHPGSGITWQWKGTPVLATTNLKEGIVGVIDIREWKSVAAIPVSKPVGKYNVFNRVTRSKEASQ